MTPDQLRDLIARSGITQQRAADLAGVALRSMQQYAAAPGSSNHRPIPASVSVALCLSLIALGAPAGLLAPWLHPDVAAAVTGETESI